MRFSIWTTQEQSQLIRRIENEQSTYNRLKQWLEKAIQRGESSSIEIQRILFNKSNEVLCLLLEKYSKYETLLENSK